MLIKSRTKKKRDLSDLAIDWYVKHDKGALESWIYFIREKFAVKAVLKPMEKSDLK